MRFNKVDDLMAKDDKVLSKGMYLLHDYYKNKANDNTYPVFILNHYSDLAVILALAPRDTIYGVIIKNGSSIHKTPIIARNNEFIILDSLGVTGTQYAMPLQIELEKCLAR